MSLKTRLPFNFLAKKSVQNQTGQVIIEYALLLVIVVGLSTLIVTQMASRNPNSPGFLIGKWNAIIEQIGADDPGQY